MKRYTADFETTVSESDCRVWAYAISEIGNPDNFRYGNSLDDFMAICADPKENAVYYFHNLKFDGEYLIHWLFPKIALRQNLLPYQDFSKRR